MVIEVWKRFWIRLKNWATVLKFQPHRQMDSVCPSDFNQDCEKINVRVQTLQCCPAIDCFPLILDQLVCEAKPTQAQRLNRLNVNESKPQCALRCLTQNKCLDESICSIFDWKHVPKYETCHQIGKPTLPWIDSSCFNSFSQRKLTQRIYHRKNARCHECHLNCKKVERNEKNITETANYVLNNYQ